MLLRKKPVLFGVLFLFVVATALVVYYTSLPDSGYTDVTVEQAKELIDTTPSLVVIDVRTDAEYNAEHIAGATNIPSMRFHTGSENWIRRIPCSFIAGREIGALKLQKSSWNRDLPISITCMVESLLGNRRTTR